MNSINIDKQIQICELYIISNFPNENGGTKRDQHWTMYKVVYSVLNFKYMNFVYKNKLFY